MGPAGVGKTSLAKQYGAMVVAASAPEGGVWFCDLCDARSTADVVAAVASVLGDARNRTRDLGGTLSTAEMGDRIAAAMGG